MKLQRSLCKWELSNTVDLVLAINRIIGERLFKVDIAIVQDSPLSEILTKYIRTAF